MNDVTEILSKIESGDSNAQAKLLPLVYDELRRLAAARLANEKPGQTLQATALVHEAYLRMVGADAEKQWDGRGHFFAAAAESMRRILVDRARKKMTQRHGGGRLRVELDDLQLADVQRNDQLLALDEALSRLERCDKTKAELVKLRYFAGMTLPEAAHSLGIGLSTADKYWAYAKVWLQAELEKS